MNTQRIGIRPRLLRARLRSLRGLACVIVLGAGPACGGDDIGRSNTRGGGESSGSAAASTASGGTEETKRKEREPLVFRDETFVESIRNRDPFRTYSTTFHAREPGEIQRRVVMPATSVDEMRLIAIVTGMPRPKAMLVAPDGIGYVVERGDYVGRPKVIQATGSVSMTLNWRVDRIRDNEVVLTQQDATDPNRAALTKIIPLRDEVAAK